MTDENFSQHWVILMGYFVHESAYVDEGTMIGDGTKVWRFSHVQSGAVIGEKCVLAQNIYIGQNVKIGDGCKIQNNVSVYDGVTLEDNVFCGPSCVFTNDLTPRAEFPKGVDNRVKTLVKKGASKLYMRQYSPTPNETVLYAVI